MKDSYLVIRSSTYEEQRKHFLGRLRERYDLEITNEQYAELCKPHKVFHGVFKKNHGKTLGWVMINGTKVWVLRDGEAGRLATCYPSNIERIPIEMIKACFNGVARGMAIEIYKMYLREARRVDKMKFDSIKDAALYFFSKTSFPNLHIDKYKKQSVTTWKVSAYIRRILCGDSDYVKLSLRRTRKKSLKKDD